MPGRTWSRMPASNRSGSGISHRDCQSEGRGGQDHHRDQHRHRDGGDRLAHAADRPRSAGQCLDRAGRALRPRARFRAMICWSTRCPRFRIVPTAIPAARNRARDGRSFGRRGRTGGGKAAHIGCKRRWLATRGHDICFIDCPPSLGLLTLNALCAADTLLVPLQCEFFALEGLSQLLQTVEQVQQRFNPRSRHHRRRADHVRPPQPPDRPGVRRCARMPRQAGVRTVIPRNVRLSEAPSHGLPALIYDQHCAGSRAYMALARELIGRFPAERQAA
jgi:chromosome partitioning protein